jgi:putative aminopeptidase FrvX
VWSSWKREEVRSLMKNMLKPHVDEIKEDKLGNVIGVKKGKKDAPKVMLAAHMDEIGLFVKTISKDGFLQFTKIGGIDDRILLAQKVIVHTEKGPLHGIIGSKPPHIQKEEERKKVMTYDELFIDIGAENQEEAKKMGVKIGDSVSFDIKFAKIGNDIVIGKAFDDRVGCAVMIEAMKHAERNRMHSLRRWNSPRRGGLKGSDDSSVRHIPRRGHSPRRDRGWRCPRRKRGGGTSKIAERTINNCCGLWAYNPSEGFATTG